MTRVEKYREYRKEILNSFYFEEKETKKSLTSKRVSEATLNKDTSNSLSVEEILDAYQLYEEKETVQKKKQLSHFQKKQLILLLIGIILIIAIIIALIVIGINIWG